MLSIMDISTTTGALCVAFVVCWLAFGSTTRRKNKNAPPSLPHLPLIGSLPFLSGLSNLHVCLMEKCKSHGKIFSLFAGSRYVVVLNGHELIREALVKNASEFAGRGEIYVEKHIWPDHGKGVVLIQASETQRKIRSNCLTVLKNLGFGSRSVMDQKIQTEVSHLIDYVRSRGGAPWYPAPILEQTAMNVIYNLMFGTRFAHDDKVGQELTDLCNKIAASVDAIYDVFPILVQLPTVQKKLARNLKLYEKYMEFCDSKVEESLRSSDDGCDNFVKEYSQIWGSEGVNKRDISTIVRDLILAGTETTSGQLNWALILLANHPDVQSRLREEVDSVVPRDRLPSLEDKSRLPYLDAVILEVLRIRTAAPLGVPRLTLEDTKIGGYDIPAGTEIVVNLWSANMDPQVWAEPEKFSPGRFLDEHGAIVNRELMIAFSQGKRSCLGEILARQEMFLFLAALVQQFNILPPEGEVKVKDEMCFIRTLTACEHKMRLVPREF